MRAFAATAALIGTVAIVVTAQDQQPRERPGWPCTGHPDPAYFRTAEATGGQVFLFHPSELAGSGRLMAAGTKHEQTLYRVAGSLQEGLHEFPVPVDADVESLLVSVSLQCLQVVEIAQPSGELLQAAAPGIEYEQYEAGRIATAREPAAGRWTVRVSGHGLFFLVAKARTAVGLEGAQVVRQGAGDTLVPVFTALSAGRREMLQVRVSEGVHDVRARLVSAGFDDAGPLELIPREDGSLVGSFTVPPHGFRVVVNAADAAGRAIQRVHAPLFEVHGAGVGPASDRQE